MVGGLNRSKIDMEAIQAKLADGTPPTEIAHEMGVLRGTVYDVKAQKALEHDSVKAKTP